MATKAYLYDGSLCIACRGCQVACKQWNNLPAEKTTFFAEGGGYQNPPDLTVQTWNLIKFFEEERNGKMDWYFRRRSCNHCKDAACINACPVEPNKAMTRHPIHGTVYIDQKLCVGCGQCTEACPFDIPKLEEKLEKSFKCWSCIDRQDKGKVPACVNTCPTEALIFGDRDVLLKQANAKLSALKKKVGKAFIYGLKEMTGLSVLYVLPGELKDYPDLPKNPKSKA